MTGQVSQIEHQCNDLLKALSVDQQMEALENLISHIRKLKKARYQSVYSQIRYQNDDELRKQHSEYSSKSMKLKYAMQPQWRDKVRQQQKEYYYRRKAAKPAET